MLYICVPKEDKNRDAKRVIQPTGVIGKMPQFRLTVKAQTVTKMCWRRVQEKTVGGFLRIWGVNPVECSYTTNCSFQLRLQGNLLSPGLHLLQPPRTSDRHTL